MAIHRFCGCFWAATGQSNEDTHCAATDPGLDSAGSTAFPVRTLVIDEISMFPAAV